MKGNNLNFDSKNLVVDYISLNIQGPINDSINPKSIANSLFQNFNFNSTIFKKINYKWKSESLNYDSQNQFQVAFWQYEYHPEVKSFWEGTKVHFSGTNAAQIYKIIQTKKFDWKIILRISKNPELGTEPIYKKWYLKNRFYNLMFGHKLKIAIEYKTCKDRYRLEMSRT
jgi:hypothetical protein